MPLPIRQLARCEAIRHVDSLQPSFSLINRAAAAKELPWRRRAPEFQEPRLRRNLMLRDALVPIAKRHDTSVSSVAIAWTLAWPGVTAAVVGARSPKQVDGWIDVIHSVNGASVSSLEALRAALDVFAVPRSRRASDRA